MFTLLIYEPKLNPRSPVEVADRIEQFLAQNTGMPFYLHIGCTYPHRAGKGFGNDREHAGIEPGSYSPDEIIVPNFLPDVPAVREDLADYYESVSRWDAVVGAALDALEASGTRRRYTRLCNNRPRDAISGCQSIQF